MIHHVSLGTNDPHRARTFYDRVMPIIGFRLMQASDRSVDYGIGDIVFSLETPIDGHSATPGNGAHVAFQARSRDMVRDFYNAAVQAGGESDGKPGLRPEYDANYFGAFVRDPDGNKIEAVTYSAD